MSGRTYTFRVEARNSVGFSAESAVLAILAAQIPDQPQAPVTSVSGSSVLIKWAIPYDGSSMITGYLISILQSDGVTYSEDTADCNGLVSSVILSLSCSVPISTLKALPYSLPWGSSVQSKVSAINIVGTS